MYQHNNVLRIFVVLLIFIMWTTACGPVATQPPVGGPSAPPLGPTLANFPTEPSVGEPSASPLGPTLANFPTEPKQIEAPSSLGGSLYLSEGTYTNELGQNFVITVTGRLAKAVTDYTSSAKFHLVATVPEKPSTPTPEEIQPPQGGKALFEVLFNDPNTENLVIDMDLAPADAEKLKDGYDLAFEVDPTVAKGYTHHYRAQHVTPSITTKLYLSSGGSITANLYRNCASTGARTIYVGGSATPLSYGTGGYAWYDLAVTGGGSSNTYSIVQGLWNNYSYYTTSTSSTSGVTCW